MSEIAQVWFEEGCKLSIGEAIFLRVINKREQDTIAAELEDERDRFATIDPTHASQLFINKTVLSAKLYVVIERKYRAPFTAFHRSAEGQFTKVAVDPTRRRMIRLMLKDGKSREEIEGVCNGLTEAEVTEFFPEPKGE